jgi:hypothetical protein
MNTHPTRSAPERTRAAESISEARVHAVLQQLRAAGFDLRHTGRDAAWRRRGDGMWELWTLREAIQFATGRGGRRSR